MRIFSLFKFFSIIGVSVIGSVFHCVGQIVIAIILLQIMQGLVVGLLSGMGL